MRTSHLAGAGSAAPPGLDIIPAPAKCEPGAGRFEINAGTRIFFADEPGWRIEIKKYPRLTTVGAQGNWSDPAAPAAFYTQADIREIIRYAAARHIMVIPEIDMPGHATAACRAYPEFSGGGTGQWAGFTFNPAKEATYQFLEDVLREIAVLFPGPYLHLGGDEVHFGNQSWSTDPEIVRFSCDRGMTDGRILAGQEPNVLGLQACVWTERIQNRERMAFMTFPRLAALAEAAWTPAAAKDAMGFTNRLRPFLRELERRRIPYFNPFHPAQTTEPPAPAKKAEDTANG
jgi:N-acetyl-beta-hexosaminidase